MIPRIIHQIWIGDKPAPTNLMRTWKEKHPGFEYILWNEEELQKRGFKSECSLQIANMREINGKADILRWEILYQYGGYFVDADSICIEPFDEYFENVSGFATFENENIREGLVATGTMGFIPNHVLCYDIIQWIKGSVEAIQLIQETRAWYSVGPGLLTKMLNTGKYADFSVFPSHCFLPVHFTGIEYTGHKKVYAYQEWGTSKQSYDTMNSVTLPRQLFTPTVWYSLLISSENALPAVIHDSLESIKRQTGYFGIEVVWIDDGSTPEHSQTVVELLVRFQKSSRFIRYIYKKKSSADRDNAFQAGLSLCSSDLVFKMNAGDLMMPDRMIHQIEFMNESSDAVLCGTNVRRFRRNEDNRISVVDELRYPSKITLEEETSTTSAYIHPSTLCFRKSAVVDTECDAFVRGILDRHGVIYNLPEALVLSHVD